MTLASQPETEFLDWGSGEVARFVDTHSPATEADARTRAVELFYAVRDEIDYEIYGAEFSRSSLKASAILEKGAGLCIHKSVVYAAALRSIGIASRLCFMDVRNHLCSPQLKKFVGGDVFHYHGYVSLFLDGRWVSATPVFNERLCRLYRIAPLEFDGVTDCVSHPFDSEGRKFMEVVRHHGDFEDLPYELLLDGLRENHPKMFIQSSSFVRGSLKDDARQIVSNAA